MHSTASTLLSQSSGPGPLCPEGRPGQSLSPVTPSASQHAPSPPERQHLVQIIKVTCSRTRPGRDRRWRAPGYQTVVWESRKGMAVVLMAREMCRTGPGILSVLGSDGWAGRDYQGARRTPVPFEHK